MGIFDFLRIGNDDESLKNETFFKSYFLSVDNVRKKDGTLKRGECEIEFFDSTFQIRQGSEIIEYNIDSIYYFDTWEFKDNTYFKFRMRSLNEIKFCSQYFEWMYISKLLKKRGVTVK